MMRLSLLMVGILLLSVCRCYPYLKEQLEEPGEKVHDSKNKEKAAIDEIIETNKGKHGLLEGDISIEESPEGILTPYGGIKSNLMKRGLRRSQEYLWVDRVVPYEFSNAVEHGKWKILEALQEISNQSCIKFVEHKQEKNWVIFADEGACFSGVGRTFWREGAQKISLANSCLEKGTIMHEVLHALGFWHEQSRSDRDKYVEIFWENINEGEEHNFAKYSAVETNDLQSPYDINSIMHYGRYSFSKNDEPTIVAIHNKNTALGQRQTLSKEDVIQLNLLYRCKDYHMGKIYTSWSEWSPCDKNSACKKSRQRFCSINDKSKCPDVNEYGVVTEEGTCPDEECYRPIDGHWNRWSSWTLCSKTCGSGRKSRTRKCDDPSPSNGGKQCVGSGEMTSECLVIPCGLDPDACQFDSQGMCYWKDASSLEYRWSRIKGTTPSSKTGPDADHSTGKGYYLYAESSAPATVGMKANLLSKVFPKTTGRCIIFSYHMHGENIGSLRVFIMSESTGNEKKIWEKNGPRGIGWNDAKIMYQSDVEYRIKIQTERGSSYLGDIGLDDVRFQTGSCDKKLVITNGPTPRKRDPLTEICDIPAKPLGCFAEVSQSPAIPNLLDSHRGPGSNSYHGIYISWGDFKTSLNSLFCDCLNRAKSRGFKYVGMQFYGECWGVNISPRYNRYGNSTLCVDGAYQRCQHVNDKEVCVGEAYANYVYEVI